MSQMRDGLWDIVNNKEGDKDILKFLPKRDRALATTLILLFATLLDWRSR